MKYRNNDRNYRSTVTVAYNYIQHTVLLQIFARSLFLRILRVNLQSQNYDRNNWASVSEPHTCDFNTTFSLYVCYWGEPERAPHSRDLHHFFMSYVRLSVR